MKNELVVKTHGWDDMGTPVALNDEEISQQAVDHFRAQKKGEPTTIGYLCKTCAVALGGEWPEGHVATCHQGTCTVCKHQRGLAAPSDWQLGSDGNRRKISPYEWD